MHNLTIFLGALAGGAVAFVWGAVSWMVLPWQHRQFRGFDDEEAVTDLLVRHAPESGIYGIPWSPHSYKDLSKEQQQALDSRVQQKMRSGPLVTVVMHRGGFGPFPAALVRGFLIYSFSALLLSIVASRLSITGLFPKALVLDLATLAGAAVCRLPDWNWHRYPPRYAFVALADVAVGWFLASLAIAAVVRAG